MVLTHRASRLDVGRWTPKQGQRKFTPTSAATESMTTHETTTDLRCPNKPLPCHHSPTSRYPAAVICCQETGQIMYSLQWAYADQRYRQNLSIRLYLYSAKSTHPVTHCDVIIRAFTTKYEPFAGCRPPLRSRLIRAIRMAFLLV